MIGGCYAISGIVLVVSAVLFQADALNATTHTIFWCVSFFFASAGRLGGLPDGHRDLPAEVRGQAISYFFAIAQASAPSARCCTAR